MAPPPPGPDAARVHPMMPALWREHRGFFLVIAGLALMHIIQGLDNLLPNADRRHSPPVWDFTGHIMGVTEWGIANMLLAVLILIGFWRPGHDLRLVRVAASLSVTQFLLLDISFITGHTTGSWFNVAAATFIIIVATAAMLEPATNPAAMEEQRRREDNTLPTRRAGDS